MAVATEGLEKLEDMIVRQAEATGAQVAAANAAIGSVIFGQEGVVEQALITVLCGGHALLIGLPGLAKTKLVETMGIVLGLDVRRIARRVATNRGHFDKLDSARKHQHLGNLVRFDQ